MLVEPLDFGRQEGLVKSFRKFKTMLWSTEAAKKFAAVLQEFKPDVIHIHNIYHHLSPSILAVAKRHKIPVVQTLHDYKWICPNYKLFTQGAICQRCRRYRYWNAVTHKCLQDSLVASGAAAGEMWWHRLSRVYEKGVARFITPSDFLRETLIKWGKDKNKIVTLHNFIKIPLVPPFTKGEAVGSLPQDVLSLSQRERQRGILSKGELERNFILFAGRLAEEKGIDLLLQIAQALPEIKFKIAGQKIGNWKLEIGNLDNVEWLGFKKKEALQELIVKARLVVAPSLWHENYPMSVLEAQAAGKAVLASASGGIPEMIKDGETGFLVNLRNYEIQPSLWVAKIKEIYDNETLLKKVGAAAREQVTENNDPEEHYRKIMEIYRHVTGAM
ncbi:MAG: glycosyltransferase family 4 protein [bacterium]|nr:glycosyltransferase family 4 protein [bacterium]